MDKCIRILEVAKQLFSDEVTTQKASQVSRC